MAAHLRAARAGRRCAGRAPARHDRRRRPAVRGPRGRSALSADERRQGWQGAQFVLLERLGRPRAAGADEPLRSTSAPPADRSGADDGTSLGARPQGSPVGADPQASRGRRHAEPRATTRSEFQRDRDRIVHCTAFRRLEYKTQVFVNHEGDLFRTRLTHSIEVAQIGRSIGRSLGLAEDLAETIALAHDLGHTPFGHAGQDALHECMREHGGFEHNLQSLRVVDELEQRYGAFDGLNLSSRPARASSTARSNARGLGGSANASCGGGSRRSGAGRQPGRRDRLQQRRRRRAEIGPDAARATRRHRPVLVCAPSAAVPGISVGA